MKEQAYNVDKDKDHKSLTTKAISLISRRPTTIVGLVTTLAVTARIDMIGAACESAEQRYDGQILETLKKMDSCKEDAANVNKLVFLLQTKKVAALRVWMSKKRKLGELLEMGDCVAQQHVRCSFTNVV
ncbi:hypothetical protein Tco_0642010 [Tanacetum coccineum]